MTTPFDIRKRRLMLRIILWAIAAVYTLVLPDVVLIYDAVVKHFSSKIAGKVPLALIILLGIVYLISSLAMKKGMRSLALLIPCTIIVSAVVTLVPYPNKHIHIPEYILMAWVIFEALSVDYEGNGILLLVFICSGLLGVVDELFQGIHPQRFYGWQDMIMNAAASTIGIFTIAGLGKVSAGDWAWAATLKQFKKTLAITFCAAAGAVLMCAYLFDVQAHLKFWGVYPGWLLGFNALFVIAGSVAVSQIGLFYTPRQSAGDQQFNPVGRAVTARLWILCPLVILIFMHNLALLIAAFGLPFR
ncbi:MAG: VanZ family protein [Proteobacteria bacterium]|nr:VanZ family protein [Pseudomonadota bacterium]